MPTSTAKWALPYPVGADPADVPTDMGALAARIEAAGPYLWATTGGDLVLPGRLTAKQATAGYVYNPAAGGGWSLASYIAADAQPQFTIGANGTHSWGPGGSTVVDTNLYRAAANSLKTDGSMTIIQGITTSVAAGASTYGNYVSGDSQPRWYVQGDGTMRWGPGGSTGVDTNLFRNGANSLRTDSSFTAGQFIYAGQSIYSAVGLANQLQMGNDGRFYFGNANDTSLYR